MGSVRGLLQLGNSKLGQSIHHFDLPAVTTCPGRTDLCSGGVCYALGGRFRFKQVQERLKWNLGQSERDDFADRMIREVRRKGVLAVRLHCSGDVYDAVYARKWLEIFRSCPRTKFWGYSRSWRCPDIWEALKEWPKLRNCKLWLSADRESGIPPVIPANCRVAWLQDTEEGVQLADLIFRVRRFRKEQVKRIGLTMICPNETPEGRSRDTNCGNCGHCWH